MSTPIAISVYKYSIVTRGIQTLKSSSKRLSLRALRLKPLDNVSIIVNSLVSGLFCEETLPDVTSLSVSFEGYTFITDLADVLALFPNTETLSLEFNSKKRFAIFGGMDAAQIQGLSTILPKLRNLKISGWNQRVCDWISSTSLGLEALDLIDNSCNNSIYPKRWSTELFRHNEASLRHFDCTSVMIVDLDEPALRCLMNTLGIEKSSLDRREGAVFTMRFGKQGHGIKAIPTWSIDESGEAIKPSTHTLDIFSKSF